MKIERLQTQPEQARRQRLARLHRHCGRNIIAYYSGFLSKGAVAGVDINDEDKAGFIRVTQGLDPARGLDLVLHTPGGSVGAAESIVDFLTKRFGGDIRAVVPQIAMSAGTMIACAAREIIMAAHSNLGPIDPLVNGIPAAGVTAEFDRAWAEIQAEPEKLELWKLIIGQYTPTFLGQCETALVFAREFVEQRLAAGMFAGLPDAADRARAVAGALGDGARHRGHDRHIHVEDCRALGLKVRAAEDDPAGFTLLMDLHHDYVTSLANTASCKIIENHEGVASIRQLLL